MRVCACELVFRIIVGSVALFGISVIVGDFFVYSHSFFFVLEWYVKGFGNAYQKAAYRLKNVVEHNHGGNYADNYRRGFQGLFHAFEVFAYSLSQYA